MHASMHACIHAWRHTRLHAYTCIHASKDACMHEIQTDRQPGRQADSHTYIRMYVRTYMHTSMHSCIHPSMHTYMVLLTPPLDWSPRSATFAGLPACARSLWSVEGRRSFHQLERKLGAWLWCIKQQTCDDFIGINPKKHLVIYFMDLTKNKCDFIGFNEVGKKHSVWRFFYLFICLDLLSLLTLSLSLSLSDFFHHSICPCRGKFDLNNFLGLSP